MLMNPDWKDFLDTQKAVFLDDGSIQFTETEDSLDTGIFPVSQLAVLRVAGEDAEQFLQGQLTCNIKELNENNSFFAAFCNAKGRALTTLLVFKKNDEFWLILPAALREKVQKKLQMYVLRSRVQLTDASEELCITGLSLSKEQAGKADLPAENFARKDDFIKLPGSRYLVAADPETSIGHWAFWLENGIAPHDSRQWHYLDISSGIAWLDADSSEEYIPQMLNIDRLGGISFNKGCYTGQEVVARTHYLGKAKRALFVGECAANIEKDGHNVLNDNGETVGKIIDLESFGDMQIFLIIMQTVASENSNLKLDNENRDLTVRLFF